MTTISLVGANRQRLDLSAELVEFAGVIRHLKAGEWTCTLSPSVLPEIIAIRPTANDSPPLQLVVADADGVVISGAVNTVTFSRSGASESVVLSGVDEFASLATRVVYPQPADAPPWNTDVYDTVTGQASAAVTELIRRHAADLARIERQLVGLTVVDQGVGVDGTWKYRLTDLASAVASIATETGLAVDLRRQKNGTVMATVGAVRNRTNLLLDEQKLADFALALTTATATTPIAAGSGEGTSRLFAIAGDEVTGTSRRELLSDQRNIDSLPALQRSADATRSAGSASTSLSGELAADAEAAYRWRRDYNLGDTIRLRAFGSTWDVVVSAVTIKASPAGWRVAPVLGTAPKHALDVLLKDVSGLADRLNNVEVA